MFSTLALSALAAAILPSVNAHGTVSGIVSNNKYYPGFAPSDIYLQPMPARVGWTTDDLSNGFIAPDAYANPNVICHTNATNAKASVPVAAGSTIGIEWTPWPSSHHGPILNYLAPCANNDCTTVDKTTLSFFKIEATGLIDDTTVPGNWATDKMIANNNTWTLTIPSNLKAGAYVLRHEIIALHSAGTADGAQNYMQCINLDVTGSGSGTASASGVLGTALYKETDPGIIVNIYTTLASYSIPGPAVPAVFASASAKFRRSFWV